MGKDKKQPKKKKEKIVYIDDGSTIADMSGVKRKPLIRPEASMYGGKQRREPVTRAGRIWQTYKDAVRAMIGPMLVTLGGVAAIFFIIWIILGFFA